MTRRWGWLCMLAAAAVVFGPACATKKYVRTTIDERVAPLEGRTEELEQSVARNTSAIRDLDTRLSARIDTVSARAEEANTRAQAAERKAEEAQLGVERTNTRLTETARAVDDFIEVRTVSVYFQTNRYDLSPEAKAELDALAEAAKSRRGIRIELSGFADRRGSEAKNLTLTENRAKSVKLYLYNVHKIEPWRIEYIGAGKINDNARTPEELQRNRRVDVRLLANRVVTEAEGGNPGP
jgi:outer membrane protein OmpA-like peptidoglycan-associated protein